MNDRYRKHYILVDKQPVKATLLEWAAMVETFDNRRIAETKFNLWWWGEIRVSTVFLGLDHSWADSGPPILFETMIFGGPFNDDMVRYATWDEAEKGHAEAISMHTPWGLLVGLIDKAIYEARWASWRLWHRLTS